MKLNEIAYQSSDVSVGRYETSRDTESSNLRIAPLLRNGKKIAEIHRKQYDNLYYDDFYLVVNSKEYFIISGANVLNQNTFDMALQNAMKKINL